MKKIRKAVFPVAGLGTRFLPATKSIPKEMLTVVDKPVIEYAVDEARAAGIEHLIFVTGRNKGVIEDHFDIQFELEQTLKARNKTAELTMLQQSRPVPGTATFTRQQEPLGLGHAVWCARDVVGDEPFALLLPDMVMKGEPGCLSQMMDIYNSFGGNVIAVEECAPELTSRYGIVGVGETAGPGFRITDMIEKPAPGTAPSNLYINGRYIIQPEVMDLLGRHQLGTGNEIQITDAMIELAKSQDFFGVRFDGRTFDCGNKVGFLSANVAFALDRPDIASEFRTEIANLI